MKKINIKIIIDDDGEKVATLVEKDPISPYEFIGILEHMIYKEHTKIDTVARKSKDVVTDEEEQKDE